ncbi:general secretion pathway protein GspK [Azoarcus sp. PA01]|nr:general secretion pathway protein GspK [Azoarcus sp. PA01]
MLAAALAAGAREELRASGTARATAEAAALGDAAIQLVAVDLRGAPERARAGAITTYNFGGREIEILISSASGFVDINRAPASLLRDLFLYGAGVEAGTAEVLADRVIDWRDPDSTAGERGAEDDAYVAAGVRFRPRGGRFESPEDLLQVLGLTFEVYDKVKPFVTLYGPGRIDPLAAPPGVLHILARGDRDFARGFAAARDAGETIIDMSAFVQDHLQPTSPASRYRVEARVADSSGQRFARVRWIELVERDGLPWRSLRVEPVRAIGAEDAADGA